MAERKKLYDRLYRAVERLQREGRIDVDLSPEEQKRLRVIRVKEVLKKYVMEESKTEKVNEPIQHETIREEITSHETRIEKPTYTEIEEPREEEEEPRSVYSQYGRIKKRLPQKPKSSLSHVIDGLFGESKTSPEQDVIRSDVSETDNPKKANPLTKSISNAVEGWRMLFRILKNEPLEKELGEEEGDTI